MLQVLLTSTFHMSGYPRQVIKVETLLRRLRFIWTALPTVITLITIIPLGTYTTSSWYIFLRDDATPLVHLSS
jgi:Na+/melibiose symporter-like transporter